MFLLKGHQNLQMVLLIHKLLFFHPLLVQVNIFLFVYPIQKKQFLKYQSRFGLQKCIQKKRNLLLRSPLFQAEHACMRRLPGFPLKVDVAFCAQRHVHSTDLFEIPLNFIEKGAYGCGWSLRRTFFAKHHKRTSSRSIGCAARTHDAIDARPVIAHRYGCRELEAVQVHIAATCRTASKLGTLRRAETAVIAADQRLRQR